MFPLPNPIFFGACLSSCFLLYCYYFIISICSDAFRLHSRLLNSHSFPRPGFVQDEISGARHLGKVPLVAHGPPLISYFVIITQMCRAEQPQGWNGRTPYIHLASFREQWLRDVARRGDTATCKLIGKAIANQQFSYPSNEGSVREHL